MDSMFNVFVIIVLGYLFGSIKVFGLNLGTSGILLVALVFGHFGLSVPADLQSFGLICFVAAVGFIAGPVFFSNFKNKAFHYIVIGLFVILAGAATTVLSILICHTPLDVTMGIFTGAMTSTPGLAAAKEVAGELAATGYAIAYPFGVVGVVLFIQLVPRVFHIDMVAEAAKLSIPISNEGRPDSEGLMNIEESGLAAFALAIVLGLLLAKVKIPLPGGLFFSLGTSGGPLIAGLLVGSIQKIGKLSLSVPMSVLEAVRELGLILFLVGAGASGGQGFVRVLQEHGVILFVIGAVITIVPMLGAYFLARTVLKLDVINSLGAICGGMTSTPALGTLIHVTKTNNVAAAYAATYPIALLAVVLATQIIAIIFQ